MKTAVSLARLPTHRARQSGFHAQAHDSALPREPSGGYRGPERQRDAGERTTCRGDLGCRLWDLSPLDAPLRRAAVYFNIGAASIYVVKFLAEPLPGGKPK